MGDAQQSIEKTKDTVTNEVNTSSQPKQIQNQNITQYDSQVISAKINVNDKVQISNSTQNNENKIIQSQLPVKPQIINNQANIVNQSENQSQPSAKTKTESSAFSNQVQPPLQKVDNTSQPNNLKNLNSQVDLKQPQQKDINKKFDILSNQQQDQNKNTNLAANQISTSNNQQQKNIEQQNQTISNLVGKGKDMISGQITYEQFKQLKDQEDKALKGVNDQKIQEQKPLTLDNKVDSDQNQQQNEEIEAEIDLGDFQIEQKIDSQVEQQPQEVRTGNVEDEDINNFLDHTQNQTDQFGSGKKSNSGNFSPQQNQQLDESNQMKQSQVSQSSSQYKQQINDSINQNDEQEVSFNEDLGLSSSSQKQLNDQQIVHQGNNESPQKLFGENADQIEPMQLEKKKKKKKKKKYIFQIIKE